MVESVLVACCPSTIALVRSKKRLDDSLISHKYEGKAEKNSKSKTGKNEYHSSEYRWF